MMRVFETRRSPRRTARILVVEDDESYRLLLHRILIKAGFHADAAEHAEDALARFDEGSYDLVITDLQMPRITGLELITKLISKRPDIRIIALSGTIHRRKHFAQAIGGGAKAILEKPLTADQLLRAVKEVLADGL
jgi:DNA-binding NtrC family response regulator